MLSTKTENFHWNTVYFIFLLSFYNYKFSIVLWDFKYFFSNFNKTKIFLVELDSTVTYKHNPHSQIALGIKNPAYEILSISFMNV